MSALKAFFSRLEIPKSRLVFHAILVIVTSGIWLYGLILTEFYLYTKKLHNVNKERDRIEHEENSRRAQEEKIRIKAEKIRKFTTSINKLIQNQDSETSFEPVTLHESRETVTTVTSGTTFEKNRTGILGLGLGNGIGFGATSGKSRGTIASQSSEVLNNDYHLLDKGSFTFDAQKVTFVGKQFVRKAKYEDILQVKNDFRNSIGLATIDSDRIWMIEFEEDLDFNFVFSVIKSLIEGLRDPNALKTTLPSIQADLEARLASLNAPN
jgi:hypothetical protein